MTASEEPEMEIEGLRAKSSTTYLGLVLEYQIWRILTKSGLSPATRLLSQSSIYCAPQSQFCFHFNLAL